MTDFMKFCQQATDNQLAEILAKEWTARATPGRKGDYRDAQTVAERRGWFVKAGKRLA